MFRQQKWWNAEKVNLSGLSRLHYQAFLKCCLTSIERSGESPVQSSRPLRECRRSCPSQIQSKSKKCYNLSLERNLASRIGLMRFRFLSEEKSSQIWLRPKCISWISWPSSRPAEKIKSRFFYWELTVSVDVVDVDKSGADGGVESGESALVLGEVKLAVVVLVESTELAGAVSAHQIERWGNLWEKNRRIATYMGSCRK